MLEKAAPLMERRSQLWSFQERVCRGSMKHRGPRLDLSQAALNWRAGVVGCWVVQVRNRVQRGSPAMGVPGALVTTVGLS